MKKFSQYVFLRRKKEDERDSESVSLSSVLQSNLISENSAKNFAGRRLGNLWYHLYKSDLLVAGNLREFDESDQFMLQYSIVYVSSINYGITIRIVYVTSPIHA